MGVHVDFSAFENGCDELYLSIDEVDWNPFSGVFSNAESVHGAQIMVPDKENALTTTGTMKQIDSPVFTTNAFQLYKHNKSNIFCPHHHIRVHQVEGPVFLIKIGECFCAHGEVLGLKCQKIITITVFVADGAYFKIRFMGRGKKNQPFVISRLSDGIFTNNKQNTHTFFGYMCNISAAFHKAKGLETYIFVALRPR